MHKRKPDADAFKHVCDEHEVAPNRALMIDDSKANCDAAALYGMQTVCITGPDLLREFASTRLARVA